MLGRSFLRYSIVVALIALTVVFLLFWFGTTSKNNLVQLELQWLGDNQRAIERSAALNRIHKSFGYGGFIHNFKNLVLRRDTSRIPLIDHNLAETYEAIRDYELLLRSDDERSALNGFRQTVDLYAEKYQLAKRLVVQQLDNDSIDAQVKVDDGPALLSLNQLARATLEYRRSMEKELGQDIAAAIAFMEWGWLLLPLFVLIGALLIYMLFRLYVAAQALQQAKQYAVDVIKAAPDALIVIDKSGNILSANVEAQMLFGYGHDELIQLKLADLLPQRFRKVHAFYVNRAFELEQPRPKSQARELLALTKDGREVPVEIALSYTHQDGGLHAIAAIRDVSERRETEQNLRLASKILDVTSEGILITDRDNRIVDINAAFSQLTGYAREELLGRRPSMLSSGRHDNAFYQQLWQSLNSHGYWKGEIWDRRKDGRLIPNLVSISAVADETGQVSNYVAVFSDITQFKEKEQRLEQLAHFDQLTGLANRMLFQDRLRAALSRAHRRSNRCAVLCVDLDGFKQVNDRLGHEVGDEVLIKVARLLISAVREDDTAARLGGDEFAIILNDLGSGDEVDALAARVLELLTFSVDAPGEQLPLSACIGIALYPEHGDDIERLLRCADQAMYYCKRHGKQSYRRFSEEMAASDNR